MTNPDLINSEHQQQVPKPVAITKPLGTTFGKETKCYICTVPAASTHRADGKKLPFVHGFMRTNIIQDIAHMEHEIDEQNPYFRHATPEEIEAYDMRTDPKGTLTRNIKADPAVRAEIEQELRAKLEAEIRAELTGTATAAKVAIPVATDPATDSAKIAGVEARLAALKSSPIKTGTATIVHKGAPAAPAIEVAKSHITPVSSTDIADATAQSGK